MAVIKGIRANVIVDGQPLEEFNAGDNVDKGVDNDSDFDSDSDSGYPASGSDDDDQKYIDDQKALQDLVNPSRRTYFGPSRRVTKYIPSVSDANFEVKVSLSRSRVQRHESGALRIILFVDGIRLKSQTWEENWYRLNSLTFKEKFVATPAGPFRKPFLFREIVTRDGHSDTADDPHENLDGVGTILVEVFRVTATIIKQTRTSTGSNYKGEVFEGLQAVSEISEHKLKGKTLTHSANLGPGKPYKHEGDRSIDRSVYSNRYVDGKIPISTFEFKYCSRKALKNMLIIPRTPSPSPLPTPVARIPSPVKPEPLHERPLDELSREELLELARAQKEQLSIKKEVNTPIIKNEVQTSVKKEGQQKVKSEYKTGIKRGRDDVDADGDDFQITMSRPVRFKPAAGKAKTIKLESDTKGEIRLATKSTKSKHQVEGS